MLINNIINNVFETTIGDGTILIPYFPTYIHYDYGYFGYIYTKTEIGVVRPVWINGIKFNIINKDKKYIFNNQKIKVGYCNQTEFSNDVRNNFTQDPLSPTKPFITSGITTVNNIFNWVTDTDNTWYEVMFDVPFLYDPLKGNLIVIWENRNGTYFEGTANNPNSKCTTNNTYNSYYIYTDNHMPPVDERGNISKEGRPNIKLILSV